MKGFTGELKAILADKKMLISMLGIIFIPVLYGILMLLAFWDPYGQLEELPVAIVNEDEGTELDGEEINVGDEFVDELLESEDFNWHVTDSAEAHRGFDEFDYYFYVTIPSTFSEDVASLQDNDPETGMIYYDINEDMNFAASQMGSQAISTIEEELSTTLTETYVEIAEGAYSELTDAAVDLRDGSEELADGVHSAFDNMGTLTDGLADLDSGADTLQEGTSEAAEGTQELRTEVESFADLYRNSEDIDQLETTLDDMQSDVTSARSYLESEDAALLEQSLRSLNENWSAARSSLQSAEDTLMDLEDRFEDTDQYVQETRDVLENMGSINEQLNTWENEANETLDDLDMFVEACYDWQASVDADEEIQSLSDYIADNYPEDEQLQSYADTLTETIEEADFPGDQPCQQADETVTSLNEIYDDMNSQAEQVSEQVDAIDEEFDDTVNTMASGREDISAWMEEVNQDLENARAAAPDEIGEEDMDLLEVFPQARSTLADLDESLSRADDVLGTVDSTIDEAETAVQTLDEGIQDLNEGANELSSEMGSALEGGLDIEEGLAELDDGAQELLENLDTLTDTLLENQLTEDQQVLFSSPVDSAAESDLHDYTYGEGLSPYFLSLGLFVGGLTLSIIYPFYEPLARHKSIWQWLFGKLGVVWTVSTFQTLVLIVVTFFALDLDIASPVWFALFMWFVSLSFLTLIFMLVALLDNPGRFIAIILLIVQLGGSGGSFPVELVPPFFQYVHDWLPMTYSVEGLRATIMMGEPRLLLEAWPLLLMMLVSIGIAWLFFSMQKKKGVISD